MRLTIPCRPSRSYAIELARLPISDSTCDSVSGIRVELFPFVLMQLIPVLVKIYTSHTGFTRYGESWITAEPSGSGRNDPWRVKYRYTASTSRLPIMDAKTLYRNAGSLGVAGGEIVF